jgi:TRAP-type C4-dicarboxylate transport system permease small subunit
MQVECAIVAAVSYFTSRNLTLLALAQLVVLVSAILGASAAHKWHTTVRTFTGEPWSTGLLMSYGWLGLAIPVAWLTLTLWVLRNDRATDELKVVTVLPELVRSRVSGLEATQVRSELASPALKPLAFRIESR